MAPKSRLRNSILFLPNLPLRVTHADLTYAFKGYGVQQIMLTVRFALDCSNDTAPPVGKQARVTFRTKQAAEKALGTLHLQELGGAPLVFSLEAWSPSIEVSGNPRKVKSLPDDCTPIQLYELLRRFGPVAYVRINKITGPTVQFWTEEDAVEMEAAIKEAFAKTTKVTLQAYSPHELYCGNLANDIDEETLETLFSSIGEVTNVRVYRGKNGRPRGYVSFSTREEAEKAIERFNDMVVDSQNMIVRHKEVIQGTHQNAQSWTGPNAESWTRGFGYFPGTTGDEEFAKRPDDNVNNNNDNNNDNNQSEVQRLTQRCTELENELAALTSELELAQAERDAWRHKFEVSDSRCKILELDGHRRKFDEEKKRQGDKQRAAAEERRRQEEKEREEKEERERAEKESKAKEEAEREKAEKARREKERKEREEAARKAKEEKIRMEAWKRNSLLEQQRCRDRDDNLWDNSWYWTEAQAFERFLVICDEFEKATYSNEKPLVFESVPWPVSDDPSDFTLEDLDWDKVENFFIYVQHASSHVEYNKLVERVHRMFHPDKWRARAVLVSVYDPDLRKALERAGNIVAQAMTPLWRASKGMDS